MRSLGAFVVAILSLLLFGAGLLSPLTPSEGCPETLDLIAFTVVPVALPWLAANLVQVPLARGALVLEGLSMALVTIWLLRNMGCA